MVLTRLNGLERWREEWGCREVRECRGGVRRGGAWFVGEGEEERSCAEMLRRVLKGERGSVHAV